jgi:two-component system nitrogen regulation response regulator NtrX
LLIEDFLERLTRLQGFRPLSFTEDALRVLCTYPWPGNVRELKNFVERMLILYAGSEVGPEDLPSEILAAPAMAAPGAPPRDLPIPSGAVDFKAARQEFEAEFLRRKLEEFEGSVSRLAESIGLERTYLYRKLKAYGIQTG